MTFDVDQHLGAVERSVSSLELDGKPARALTLERSYNTTVDDLWDARDERRATPALVSAGHRRAHTWAAATSWKATQAV